MSRRLVAAVLLLALSGCNTAPPPARTSLGSELKKQDDQLVGQRFRTLLDFESDADLVFTKAEGACHRTAQGHTGEAGFYAEQGVSFKIDPLLYGTKLPAAWTLLGVYVRAPADEMAMAQLLIDHHVAAEFSRQIGGGGWAFVGIDLTAGALGNQLNSAGSVTLRMNAREAEYDDVLLVDNTRTLICPAEADAGWQIIQRGGSLKITSAGRFATSIPLAAAAADGWSIDELSPLRLRLHTDRRWMTLRCDGRYAANDGSGLLQQSGSSMAVAWNQPTAELDIDEADGRLDRDTDGDANNDGYNEKLGAFQVRAAGPRLAFKLTPGSTPMQSPLIEISGLPGGDLKVLMEGKIVNTVCRLPGGHVLVLLPFTLDRLTEVTVRSSDNR